MGPLAEFINYARDSVFEFSRGSAGSAFILVDVIGAILILLLSWSLHALDLMTPPLKAWKELLQRVGAPARYTIT
jgi:hypothetical protein